METETVAAPAQTPAVWEDFIDIFVSPREVFERRREGIFVTAMITLTLLLAILAIPTQMSMAEAVEAAMQETLQSSATNEISQEQLQQFGRFSVVMAAIGTLFATPFGILMTGVVLWAASRLVDATLSFAPAIMIATYAAFPKLLAIVATMVQAVLIDPTSVNQVSLGPARFLGEGSDPIVTGLLLRLDVFTIWGVVLLAIGVTTVSRTSGTRGWIAAGITWVAAALPALVMGIVMASRG